MNTSREARLKWGREYAKLLEQDPAAREKRRGRQRKYSTTPQHRAYRRSLRLRLDYGITVEKYDALLQEQGGHCACCPEVHNGGKRLFVDHDHETGQIRGLLCARCNLTLGTAGDCVYRLLSLIGYLLR
jgi:hypothetical protein